MSTFILKHLLISSIDEPVLYVIFSAYGNLTVRSLLDTREQFLNESQFSDPYALVSAAYIYIYIINNV
jgi:hypothetical protein